ncbi:UNVERIFIED_CONTAM: hypothetical protein K2H54_013758 [Gekko kuhli]
MWSRRLLERRDRHADFGFLLAFAFILLKREQRLAVCPERKRRALDSPSLLIKLPSETSDMDPEDMEQLAAEMRGKTVSGWDLLQIAAGTGLAAYVVWAGILMPGFRRVPLKLQVPYIPASARQLESVMLLLEGRSGKLVDLGSGDGRIVLEAYRRGFRPTVGYELNPWLLRLSGYRAWKAGCYGKVSYRREDLWKPCRRDLSYSLRVAQRLGILGIVQRTSISRVATGFKGGGQITRLLSCLFQLQLLERKLLTELPDEARVVAGRFPLPTWTPTSAAGDGPNRAWAYDLKAVRQARQDNPEGSSA